MCVPVKAVIPESWWINSIKEENSARKLKFCILSWHQENLPACNRDRPADFFFKFLLSQHHIRHFQCLSNVPNHTQPTASLLYVLLHSGDLIKRNSDTSMTIFLLLHLVRTLSSPLGISLSDEINLLPLLEIRLLRRVPSLKICQEWPQIQWCVAPLYNLGCPWRGSGNLQERKQENP